jgi:hypothetical protein
MGDESAKRAAEEFLAAKIAEENQTRESQLNQEAAIALGPTVWKRVVATVTSECHDWNAVTNEQTLSCKETALGDLRLWCVGRPYQMIVHYDSRKGFVTIKNSARPENEPDTILRIVGYSNDTGRDAHLIRSNGEPVNLDRLILGHLRVLAGLSRRAE